MMRLAVPSLVLVLVLAMTILGCAENQVTIREVMPENNERNKSNRSVEDSGVRIDETITEATKLSLIAKRPQTFLIGGVPYRVMLLNSQSGSARIDFNGTIIDLPENQTTLRPEYIVKINELGPNSIRVPRRSWVDLSLTQNFSSMRREAWVDEEQLYRVNDRDVTVLVDFVKEEQSRTVARIVVNGQGFIIDEKEDHLFDDGLYLQVHEISFSDGTEHAMIDAATVTIRPR